MADPANPDPTPDPSPASPDPAASPQANPSPANERPDWLPETLWSDTGFNAAAFEQYRPPAADLPSSPDAFTVPEKIGEFDTSNIDAGFLKTLRQTAFDHGIGQESFTKALEAYATDAEAEASAYFEAQQEAIGDNRETRTTQVSTWLDGQLPPAEAEALRSVATNAEVFKALERLMNKGVTPVPRDPNPNPAPTRKTEAEIRQLMDTPEYRGNASQRKAEVIQEVTKWFEEQARLEEAARAAPKP